MKKIEHILSIFIQKFSIHFLRYSLGIIFLWYGFLKVIGISPIEELVYRATHRVGTAEFDHFLGVWEMAIGLFFFFKNYVRWALILFFLQIPGTFLPLFLNPEDCFTIFPYGLTLEGQYIFKNIILIAAALTIFGSLHSAKEPKDQ